MLTAALYCTLARVGFLLVTASDASQSVERCDKNQLAMVNKFNGSIQSPNYPGGKMVKTNCTWKLQQPDDGMEYLLVFNLKEHLLYYEGTERSDCLGRLKVGERPILCSSKFCNDNTCSRAKCMVFSSSTTCQQKAQNLNLRKLGCKRRKLDDITSSFPVTIAFTSEGNSKFEGTVKGFQAEYIFVSCSEETNRFSAGATASKIVTPTPDTNPVSVTSIAKNATSSTKAVTTTVVETSLPIVAQTTQTVATTAQTTTTTAIKSAPQTTIANLQTSAVVTTAIKTASTTAVTPQIATTSTTTTPTTTTTTTMKTAPTTVTTSQRVTASTTTATTSTATTTPTAATTTQRATGTVLPHTRPIGTKSGNFSESAVTEQSPDWIIYAAVGGSVGALLLLMIVISLLVWNRRKKKMHASQSRSTAEELFNPIYQTEGYVRAGTLDHRDLNTVGKSTMEKRSFADDESFGDESDPGDNAAIYTDVMKNGEEAPTRYGGGVPPQAKPPMSTFMS